MKKCLRKVLIFILIFVFLFSLFGFTNTLASNDTFKLVDAIIMEKDDDVDATISSFDDDDINTNMTFYKLNSSVSFKLSIKNNSNDNYKIETITSDNLSETIIFEFDKHENDDFLANNTLDLVVKATYKNEVDDMTKRDENNSFKLIIKLIDENGREEEKEISINPKTNDKVVIYLIVLIISSLMLIILLSYKNKKINKLLVMLALLLPVIVCATNINLVVTFKNNILLKDKILVTVNNNGKKEEKILTYNEKLKELNSANVPGYVFDGWYSDNDLFDFSKPITEDVTIEAKYNLITYDITYDLDGGVVTNPKTYTVEDEIVLNKPTKEGYNFAGWTGSNGEVLQPTVTINKGTTGNLNYKANFMARDDIPYTVIHKYEKLDGTYDEVEVEDTGVLDTAIKPEVINKEGFTSPSEVEITLKINEENKVEYIYTRNSYTLTFNTNGGSLVNSITGKYEENITIPTNPTKEGYNFNGWDSNIPEKIPAENKIFNANWQIINYQISYELNGGSISGTNPTTYNIESADITLINPTKEGYNFVGWTGTDLVMTSSQVVITQGSVGNKNYVATWVPVSYTVSFNTQGGSSVTNIIKKYGETLTLSELPTTTKKHNSFTGWYTESESGNLFSDITVTSNIEYFAHWSTTFMCRKATSLHTETCERTDSQGCRANGYYLNGKMKTATIVYGETSGNTTPVKGDAYDCDVTGIGNYERFYYIGTNGDNAVLVFSQNYDGENGNNITKSYDYEEASTKLPTKEQWKNIDVYFDNDTKAARFITMDEVKTVCETGNGSYPLAIKNCEYILENTSFRYIDADSVPDDQRTVRTGIWILKDDSLSTTYRIHAGSLQVTTNTRQNVARPVIEVPLSLMDDTVLTKYTITFDAKGGIFTENASETYDIEKASGSAIRILPSPTSDMESFDGWYLDEEYKNPVTLPIIVTENKIYYAKWIDATAVAIVNGARKSTLKAAIDAVPTDGTKTTVTLLQDVAESITITNRNVSLDLNGHTVSKGTGSQVFVIGSGATLEVYNGTVTSNASSGMINVNSGGTLNIVGGNYVATGNRQAVYIDGGTVNISGDALLTSSSTERATVQVHSGTLNINGGTIKSTGAYAVYNESGTLNIGEIRSLDITNPVIQGKTYGVIAYNNYDFYDGIIKGSTYPVGIASGTGNNPTITADNDKSKIIARETDTIYISGSETQDEVLYKTLYLRYEDNVYIITFDAGSGTASSDNLVINRGDPLGALPTATWDSEHTFGGWFTTNTYTVEVTTATIPTGNETNITYYAKWIENAIGEHIVTFETEGGSSVLPVNVMHGDTLPSLPTSTKTGFNLEGWYTEKNGEGTKLTLETTFDTDKTYYANWQAKEMICRVVANASNLETESCNAASGKGCTAAGTPSTITYGSLYEDNLTAGNALDCKLTTDGDYTERFYYLRDNGNNGVLISHSILSLATPGTLIPNTEQITYAGALDSLPLASQWNNLPITFEIENKTKAARLATVEDIRTACNLGDGTTTSSAALNSCTFLLANTGFANNTGRSCYWIEKSDTTYFRVRGDNRSIATADNASSQNSVKAVIEIPLDQIDLTYTGKFNVTFNANGGDVGTTNIEVNDGDTIDNLPEPTYINNVFDGWYTSANGGTLVTTSMAITESMTVYAHWTKSVKLADVDTSDVAIKDNETYQINVEEDSNLENYTFSSSDDTIATVDNNGLVTAHTIGDVVITITGDRSHLTRTINLYVTNIDIVSFNPTNAAMTVYYNNISTWKNDSTTLEANMQENFNSHNCKCSPNETQCGLGSSYNSSYVEGNSQTINCDDPNGYDTSTNGNVLVYTYDLETKTHSANPVTYAKSTNGIIYNLITDQVYYWELESDSTQNGYVKFTGERRFIESGDIHNARDLGGLPVDTNEDGVIDGYLKYEKLFRGARLRSTASIDELTMLGITEELDLREANSDNKFSNYVRQQIQNYIVDKENYASNYTITRNGVKKAMEDIVAGNVIFYHCTIGTDRTGTLSYVLEGLLGVPDEDRIRDYELSFYSGLINRHRYNNTQPGSSVSANRRFKYMYDFMPTNDKIYDWYMAGSTDIDGDNELIANFRTAMIDYLT